MEMITMLHRKINDVPHAALAVALKNSRRQNGMTLLELLVGMMIGLLIIFAAIGTLVMSRSTTRTLSDATELQQQASYALQLIGRQIRQAGGLELVQTDPANSASPFSFYNWDPNVIPVGTEIVQGTGTTLTVATQASFSAGTAFDCLGNTVDDIVGGGATSSAVYTSTFSVNGNVLSCQSTRSSNSGGGTASATAQPIISGVEDFQVRYRNITTNAVGNGTLTIDNTPAATTATTYVKAIEICLELQGNETVPDVGAQYVNCQGDTVDRGTNIRQVFRNVFNVRAQLV